MASCGGNTNTHDAGSDIPNTVPVSCGGGSGKKKEWRRRSERLNRAANKSNMMVMTGLCSWSSLAASNGSVNHEADISAATIRSATWIERPAQGQGEEAS
jgi:hypothetical protein